MHLLVTKRKHWQKYRAVVRQQKTLDYFDVEDRANSYLHTILLL